MFALKEYEGIVHQCQVFSSPWSTGVREHLAGALVFSCLLVFSCPPAGMLQPRGYLCARD